MRALLWQLLDSGFPSGAYTRSGGLEAAVALEGLQGEEGLQGFMRQALMQAAGTGLPLVNEAWDRPEELPRWHAEARAALPNAVTLAASRAQGRALWDAALRIFGAERVEGLQAPDPQHAPLSGALLKRLGAARDEARRAFLYWALRDAASAAVRLNLLGSYAAQRLQQSQAQGLEQWVEASEGWGVDDLAQQAPLMDLWQAGHARLQRRLFQS